MREVTDSSRVLREQGGDASHPIGTEAADVASVAWWDTWTATRLIHHVSVGPEEAPVAQCVSGRSRALLSALCRCIPRSNVLCWPSPQSTWKFLVPIIDISVLMASGKKQTWLATTICNVTFTTAAPFQVTRSFEFYCAAIARSMPGRWLLSMSAFTSDTQTRRLYLAVASLMSLEPS